MNKLVVILVALNLLNVNAAADETSQINNYSGVELPFLLHESKAFSLRKHLKYQKQHHSRWRGTSPACGHTPACAIFLPVMLLSGLTTEPTDVVELTDADRLMYQLVYGESGELRQALVMAPDSPDEYILVDRNELPQLGMVVYLKRFQYGTESDGKHYFTLLKQHNFIQQYTERLAMQLDDKERLNVLEEAVVLLGSESLDLVVTVLNSVEESTYLKRQVIENLCDYDDLNNAQPVQLSDWITLPVMTSTPELAAAGLACVNKTDNQMKYAGKLTDALITWLCKAEVSESAMEEYLDLLFLQQKNRITEQNDDSKYSTSSSSYLTARLPDCQSLYARIGLSLIYRHPINAESIRLYAESNPQELLQLITDYPLSNEVFSVMLEYVLFNRADVLAVLEAADNSQVKIFNSQARQLAELYLREEASNSGFFFKGDHDYRKRILILGLLKRFAMQPSAASGVANDIIVRFETALSEQQENVLDGNISLAEIHIVLAVLGVEGHLLASFQHIDSERKPKSFYQKARQLVLEDARSVVISGGQLLGCDFQAAFVPSLSSAAKERLAHHQLCQNAEVYK